MWLGNDKAYFVSILFAIPLPLWWHLMLAIKDKNLSFFFLILFSICDIGMLIFWFISPVKVIRDALRSKEGYEYRKQTPWFKSFSFLGTGTCLICGWVTSNYENAKGDSHSFIYFILSAIFAIIFIVSRISMYQDKKKYEDNEDDE